MIAETVFGLVPSKQTVAFDNWPAMVRPGREDETFTLWHYSTSISDSWAIVDAMTPNWIVTIHLVRRTALVTMTGGFGPLDRKNVQKEANTVPLAICRAALEAFAR
jgi:Phage ABA sandwich domain